MRSFARLPADDRRGVSPSLLVPSRPGMLDRMIGQSFTVHVAGEQHTMRVMCLSMHFSMFRPPQDSSPYSTMKRQVNQSPASNL